MLLALPLVVCSTLALRKLVTPRWASYIVVIFSIVIFTHTVISEPAPYVSGYRSAAEYVCSIAPPDSIVLFSGMRDGSFVFNVRSLPQCKNITVIRSDKLLLQVAVDREKFGVTEIGVNEMQFRQMLQQYGVRYIVLEPSFWNDLQSMQMLVRTIHEGPFKLLRTIPIVSNFQHTDQKLEIYENMGNLATGKSLLRIELPVSGITVQGQVGKEK